MHEKYHASDAREPEEGGSDDESVRSNVMEKHFLKVATNIRTPGY